MSRYVKRPRGEPTDELLIAGWLVLGPFMLLGLVAQGIWRCLLREDREQQGKHDNTCRDEGQ